MSFILASSSPRRQELLARFGIQFEVKVVPAPESVEGVPVKVAENNALAKAFAVANSLDSYDIILAADTIVVLDNQILGKPRNESDAYQNLRLLSGQEHSVITGVALLLPKQEPRVFHEETIVKFRKINDEEIKTYIKTKEPLDKAGSYGIQGIGGMFVESINGCYFNVVGLPMPRLALELRSIGIDVIKLAAQGRFQEVN